MVTLHDRERLSTLHDTIKYGVGLDEAVDALAELTGNRSREMLRELLFVYPFANCNQLPYMGYVAESICEAYSPSDVAEMLCISFPALNTYADSLVDYLLMAMTRSPCHVSALKEAVLRMEPEQRAAMKGISARIATGDEKWTAEIEAIFESVPLRIENAK